MDYQYTCRFTPHDTIDCAGWVTTQHSTHSRSVSENSQANMQHYSNCKWSSWFIISTFSHNVGYTSIRSQRLRPVQPTRFPVQLTAATSPGLPYGSSNSARPSVDGRLFIPASPGTVDDPKPMCASSISDTSSCRRLHSRCTFCPPSPMVHIPFISLPALSVGSWFPTRE